jgi:hypothetical protein
MNRRETASLLPLIANCGYVKSISTIQESYMSTDYRNVLSGVDAERHERNKFEYVNKGGYYHSLADDPLRLYRSHRAGAACDGL